MNLGKLHLRLNQNFVYEAVRYSAKNFYITCEVANSLQGSTVLSQIPCAFLYIARYFSSFINLVYHLDLISDYPTWIASTNRFVQLSEI